MALALPNETTPTTEAVLLAVAGPERGNVFSLSREVSQQIEGRFSVSWSEGIYVAKSLTEKEIMVGGELVTESILNPGDVIITEAGEYNFRVSGAASPVRSRAWTIGIATLAGLVVALFALPLYERREQPPVTPASPAVARPMPPRPLVVPAAPPPLSTADDNLDRIGRARLRYALAEDYSQQSALNVGMLFWAIQEWKQVEVDVAGMTPVPDVVERARVRRAAAEKQLEEKKILLRNAATIAFYRGDLGLSEEALHDLLSITQSPEDPAYLWTVGRLNAVHAMRASADAAKGGGAK